MVTKTPYRIDVPVAVLSLRDSFKASGFLLYLVGGAVRDSLLGKKPKDYDLATDASPDDVTKICEGAGYRTLDVGKAFGVVRVLTDEGEYEIATFREDIGAGRRPEAIRFADVLTDACRRDLTVNALYHDLDGNVIDVVGGMQDINKRVIRTVGVPAERFGEDRLRVLRAVRMAAKLDFTLDEAVVAELYRDSNLVGVSAERIRDEFLKGIATAVDVFSYFSDLHRFNLFKRVFPGLQVTFTPDSVSLLKMIGQTRDPLILIAWLLRDNTSPAITDRLRAATYTVDEMRAITFLSDMQDLSTENAVSLKRRQRTCGLTVAQIRQYGFMIDTMILDSFLCFELEVRAEQVMKDHNMPPGQELGKMINKLEKERFFRQVQDHPAFEHLYNV